MFKTFISILSVIFLSTLQVAAFSIEEKPAVFTISDLKIQNAQWDIPTDGQKPKLLSYEIDFRVDATHTLHARINLATFENKMIPPNEFIQDENEIEISQEGFILGYQDFSWFRVQHLSSGVVFDAKGNSIKAKTGIPEGAYPIKEVRFDNGNVHFRIQNYFVTLKIESEKYHGFYEDKPLFIREMSPGPENKQKQYHYRFVLEDTDFQQIEALSLPLNENTFVAVKDLNPINIDYRGSFSWAVFTFNIELTFVDSEQNYKYVSTSKYSSGKSYNGASYEKMLKNFQNEMGNEFIIEQEIPDANNLRNSYFTLRSLKNGKDLELYGPARKAK